MKYIIMETKMSRKIKILFSQHTHTQKPANPHTAIGGCIIVLYKISFEMVSHFFQYYYDSIFRVKVTGYQQKSIL